MRLSKVQRIELFNRDFTNTLPNLASHIKEQRADLQRNPWSARKDAEAKNLADFHDTLMKDVQDKYAEWKGLLTKLAKEENKASQETFGRRDKFIFEMKETYAKLEKQLPKVQFFDGLAQIKKELEDLRRRVKPAVEWLSESLQRQYQLQENITTRGNPWEATRKLQKAELDKVQVQIAESLKNFDNWKALVSKNVLEEVYTNELRGIVEKQEMKLNDFYGCYDRPEQFLAEVDSEDKFTRYKDFIERLGKKIVTFDEDVAKRARNLERMKKNQIDGPESGARIWGAGRQAEG